MLKKSIATLLCVLPMLSTATTLQQNKTPWRWLYPAAEPLNQTQMLVVSADLANETIDFQWYGRHQSGGWSNQKQLASLPFAELSKTPLQWFAQQSLRIDGHVYTLLSGAECKADTPCVLREYALIHYSKDGKVEPLTSSNPLCETPKPPEMSDINGQLQLIDGCNRLWHLQDGALLATTQTTQPIQTSFAKLKKDWRWSLSGDNTRWNVSVHQPGNTLEYAFEGLAPTCIETLPVSADALSLQCQFAHEDKKLHLQLSFTAEQVLHKTLDQPSSELISIVGHDEHLYAIQTSEKSHTLSNLSAVETADAYSYRQFQRRDSSHPLQKLQRSADAKREPSGFYTILPLIHESDRVDFFTFDGIPQNFPPFSTAATEFVLGSGQTTELPWGIMDEDTLAAELQSSAQLPEWLSLEQKKRTWISSPQHRHFGTREFMQTVTDPQGLSLELGWRFDVKLMPYQLMVFESEWFERWGLKQPVPVEALLKQLKSLPITEDKSFRWVFSVLGRSATEVTVTISQPDFITQETIADTGGFALYGTALQSHVGEHVATIRVKDEYSPEPFELTIPMQVFEVDEPFNIKSVPQIEATVASLYQYQMAIDDEESAISEFSITPIHMPEFLQWSTATHSLSGTPSRKDVGNHRVAMALTDQGGHRMVQQWSITVTEEAAETQGGAFGHALVSFMLCALYLRRRHWHHGMRELLPKQS